MTEAQAGFLALLLAAMALALLYRGHGYWAWQRRRGHPEHRHRLHEHLRRARGSRARTMLEDREGRLHLTGDIYLPPPDEPGLGRLEAALDKAVEGLAVEAKIRDAVRDGTIDRAPGNALVELALKAGVISEADRERLSDADQARDEAIQVDAFDPDSYRALVR